MPDSTLTIEARQERAGALLAAWITEAYRVDCSDGTIPPAPAWTLGGYHVPPALAEEICRILEGGVGA